MGGVEEGLRFPALKDLLLSYLPRNSPLTIYLSLVIKPLNPLLSSVHQKSPLTNTLSNVLKHPNPLLRPVHCHRLWYWSYPSKGMPIDYVVYRYCDIYHIHYCDTPLDQWKNIIPPGIVTIRESPIVGWVLNMFHWELCIIIPSFISIIQPCRTDWIWNYQHQLPVISNASPNIVSEGEVLRNVVFNPDDMQPINHQYWNKHWRELISSYLEMSFQIIKLVGPLWISCRAKENPICSSLNVC